MKTYALTPRQKVTLYKYAQTKEYKFDTFFPAQQMTEAFLIKLELQGSKEITVSRNELERVVNTYLQGLEKRVYATK